jgi:hypothetical protein
MRLVGLICWKGRLVALQMLGRSKMLSAPPAAAAAAAVSDTAPIPPDCLPTSPCPGLACPAWLQQVKDEKAKAEAEGGKKKGAEGGSAAGAAAPAAEGGAANGADKGKEGDK